MGHSIRSTWKILKEFQWSIRKLEGLTLMYIPLGSNKKCFRISVTGFNLHLHTRKIKLWCACTSVLPASWTRNWQQPILSALYCKSIKCWGFLPFTTIIVSLNMSRNSLFIFISPSQFTSSFLLSGHFCELWDFKALS